jgi:hypothetical protein
MDEVNQLAGGLEGRRPAGDDVLDPATELIVGPRLSAAALDEKCPPGQQDRDFGGHRAISLSVRHTDVVARAAVAVLKTFRDHSEIPAGHQGGIEFPRLSDGPNVR